MFEARLQVSGVPGELFDITAALDILFPVFSRPIFFVLAKLYPLPAPLLATRIFVQLFLKGVTFLGDAPGVSTKGTSKGKNKSVGMERCNGLEGERIGRRKGSRKEGRK